MESNGTGNRIHVSQATADLLIQANQGHWLTPREEMVFAKGKGCMQTYFVTVEGGGSSGSSDARRSDVFDAGHAHSLVEETIDVFDQISCRQRSTRHLSSANIILSNSDGEDESTTKETVAA